MCVCVCFCVSVCVFVYLSVYLCVCVCVCPFPVNSRLGCLPGEEHFHRMPQEGHRLWDLIFSPDCEMFFYRSVCFSLPWVSLSTTGDHRVLACEMGKPQDAWGDETGKCVHVFGHEEFLMSVAVTPITTVPVSQDLIWVRVSAGLASGCQFSAGRLPPPPPGSSQQPLPWAGGDFGEMALHLFFIFAFSIQLGVTGNRLSSRHLSGDRLCQRRGSAPRSLACWPGSCFPCPSPAGL